jgi:hypothetical protein
MCEKNIRVVNDEDGFIIISVAGKEYISMDEVPMYDGKFKASDIEKATFWRW